MDFDSSKCPYLITDWATGDRQGNCYVCGNPKKYHPLPPNVAEKWVMRLTETSVSPTELVDVNLGTAPIAELNLRTVPYYLELWAKAVSKFGYIVVYCRKSARAKVVDKDSKVTIIKLPCKHPLQLKGYYISFRLLGDDFREFEHYLHSIQGAQRSNSIFGKIDYFPFRNNHSNNKSKYAPEIEENQSHIAKSHVCSIM
mmetsp:Transcript_63348/g.124806  ORF Transcript_63348/g.124806 Transcript_63348/m.124806 type:complete len:199 (-) Transcript_63348:112-708(-)